jgi:hypothetical protein
VIGSRSASLPPVADLVKAAAVLAATAESCPKRSGNLNDWLDPLLLAEWPRVLATLTTRLGDETVAAWFRDSVVPYRVLNGTLTLVAESRFIASYVSQNFIEPMQVAARAAWPAVTSVRVVDSAKARAA